MFRVVMGEARSQEASRRLGVKTWKQRGGCSSAV